MKKQSSSSNTEVVAVDFSDTDFLNAFLENADALFLILDSEGRICRFNKACELISGYTFEEVKGKFPWETVLPSEDADKIRQEAFDALVNNPQRLRGRYNNHWISKDGRRYLIDWTNTLLLDDNNRVKYLVSSGIDITELQQARDEAVGQELRNRVILDTTMDGYALTNMRGEFLDANASFINMLGYSRDELLDLSIPHIEAIESPEEVRARFEKIVEQGHDRFESKHRRKDGTIIDVEVSASIAEIGDETYVFAFQRDITDRKQAEQELNASKDAAEEASRAKSEFLSRMSHELRTPMNAILGFSQLLEMEGLTQQQKGFLDEISQAGEHLLKLINELLDLSRIESGKMETAIEPVALLPELDHALAIVHPLIAEKGLNINMKCVDRAVYADKMRLKQVLLNLLSNSAKYNRREGEITILCEIRPEKQLRVSITDTGEGISEEDWAKLFTPFERLGAEHKGIEGTGIGLVLCRYMIEDMGGRIGVDSEAGDGSTFWFELPLVDPAD